MKRTTLLAGLSAVVAAAATAAFAGAALGGSGYPVLTDSQMSPQFTTQGGAAPQPTDRTVAHWHGQFTDPTNGVTYGYNMVGSEDPRDPGAGTTTIPTDVIPIDLTFAADGGAAMKGSDVLQRTLASPIFQTADYSRTSNSTGGAGELSKGNKGVQYEDAIMRSQFDKVGTGYHLVLGQPTVWPTVSISVPANQGQLYQGSRGQTFGLISLSWFAAQLQNELASLNLDPTHLPVFLTDNVYLYISSPGNCCILGFHGAGHVPGNGTGSVNGNGNQPLLTYAWASYVTPGTWSPTRDPFIKDIHALSHEISEWGDDPFVNNTVDPWVTPTAPQYGCTAYLETGDPVVGIGFSLPGNTYDTNAYSDGTWHPEDEVFLPWFARESPNTTSQPVQDGTTGRYTFMGDLNPYPGFQQPATGC